MTGAGSDLEFELGVAVCLVRVSTVAKSLTALRRAPLWREVEEPPLRVTPGLGDNVEGMVSISICKEA